MYKCICVYIYVYTCVFFSIFMWRILMVHITHDAFVLFMKYLTKNKTKIAK